MRWNLKEDGCREVLNLWANLWSDEQKLHKWSCMRVSLYNKSKPNNYTESYGAMKKVILDALMYVLL